MEKFWVVTDERDNSLAFVAFSDVSRIIPVMDDKNNDIYCYIVTKTGKREEVRKKNEHELPMTVNEDEILFFLQNGEFICERELYREDQERDEDLTTSEEYINSEDEFEPFTPEDLNDIVLSGNVHDDSDDFMSDVQSFLED